MLFRAHINRIHSSLSLARTGVMGPLRFISTESGSRLSAPVRVEMNGH
jgi:hypothetical protein